MNFEQAHPETLVLGHSGASVDTAISSLDISGATSISDAIGYITTICNMHPTGVSGSINTFGMIDFHRFKFFYMIFWPFGLRFKHKYLFY